jgi:microcystin-dependent protein
VPVHQGSGFTIGQLAGTEAVTISTTQMPSHTHTFVANDGTGDVDGPANAIPAAAATFSPYYSGSTTVNMEPTMLSVAGGSQPHENMLPFVVVSYIISLFGVFPTQN